MYLSPAHHGHCLLPLPLSFLLLLFFREPLPTPPPPLQLAGEEGAALQELEGRTYGLMLSLQPQGVCAPVTGRAGGGTATLMTAKLDGGGWQKEHLSQGAGGTGQVLDAAAGATCLDLQGPVCACVAHLLPGTSSSYLSCLSSSRPVTTLG